MMKILILVPAICFLAGTIVMAQGDSLQQEINQQVWKPFNKAFNERNTENFMRVHSKDMTRVIQDGNQAFGYETYYENTRRNNERAKQNPQSVSRIAIELRFTQRIAQSDRAFEVGYYRVNYTLPDGSNQAGYGKFHVLLRKENGTWKILMDADAKENTDEAVFQTGEPMQ